MIWPILHSMSVIKHKVLKLLLRFERLIAPQIQQGHTQLIQKFRPSGQKKLILSLGGVVNGGFALTCGCVSTEFDEIATTANPFWTFTNCISSLAIILPVRSPITPLHLMNTK
jgi:hypothetical protein